jgi:threonine synthase
MDIQVASNFERLHFAYAGAGNLQTAAAFEAFAREGELTLPPAMLSAMGEVFTGVSADETETRAAIAAVYESAGMLIDPHTAVAVAAAAKAPALDRAIPLVVLATAHPAKFPDAVAAAAGAAPAIPRAVAGLAARPERFERLPAEAQAVKAFVRDFAAA